MFDQCSTQITRGWLNEPKKKSYMLLLCSMALLAPQIAAAASDTERTVLSNIQQIFSPKKDHHQMQLSGAQLSDFSANIPLSDQLPTQYAPMSAVQTASSTQLNLLGAIQLAVSRSPSVSAAIASLAQQGEQVDIAKSAYFPQVSAGLRTGRLGTGESTQQLATISASQLLYDFGKTQHSVEGAQASVAQQKANILRSIEDISQQTAVAVVNIQRYQALEKLAQNQLNGIKNILHIATLRADAGLSSQADPTQAQTRYENAQSVWLQANTSLRQWENQLHRLTGLVPPYQVADLPEQLIVDANIDVNPDANTLSAVMVAEYARQAAVAQKALSKANRLPTVSLEGSMSQAIHGVNPNNNKNGGTYSSVMLQLNSNFWQGGALAARTRAASYAEQAARATIEAAYLDASIQINDYREQIVGAQQRLSVLASREKNIIKTRELYEDQYKLGTRTILDLLNSEQEIYLAASDRENTHYDIWQNIVNYIAVSGRTRSAYALDNTIIQGLNIQP